MQTVTFTKVIGRWIRGVDTVSFGRRMEPLMMETGQTISRKATARQTGKMGRIMRDSTRQANATDRVPTGTQMGQYTRVPS